MKLKKFLGIMAAVVAGKVIADVVTKKLSNKAGETEDSYDYCDECKHVDECEHTSEDCHKNAESDEDIVTKAAESLNDADIKVEKETDGDSDEASEKAPEMTDEEAEEAIKQLVDEHDGLDDVKGEKSHTKLADLSEDDKAALKAEMVQEFKSKFNRDEIRRDLLTAIDKLDTKVTAAIPVAEEAINKAINKATELSDDAADAGKQFVADHPELKKYIDTSIDTIKNTVDANFGTDTPETSVPETEKTDKTDVHETDDASDSNSDAGSDEGKAE